MKLTTKSLLLMTATVTPTVTQRNNVLESLRAGNALRKAVQDLRRKRARKMLRQLPEPQRGCALYVEVDTPHLGRIIMRKSSSQYYWRDTGGELRTVYLAADDIERLGYLIREHRLARGLGDNLKALKKRLAQLDARMLRRIPDPWVGHRDW